MNDQCECMDGPNHVDPTCLYCGGTGVYASDERLAQLVERYTYLVDNSDGIGRGDFTASDRQHVAIFKALQIARTNEALIVAANISKAAPQEASEIIRLFLACSEVADCAPEDLDQETRTLERRARRFLDAAAQQRQTTNT